MKSYKTFDNDYDVTIPEQQHALTEKEELSSEDIEVLITNIVLPFCELVTGRTLFNYQSLVAYGISYSVIAGLGWTMSILQARQCIAGSELILDRDGSVHRLEDAPNSWKVKDQAEVFTLETEHGYRISALTKEHLIAIPGGYAPLEDLRVGDLVEVLRGSYTWLGETIESPRYDTFDTKIFKTSPLEATSYLQQFIGVDLPDSSLDADYNLGVVSAQHRNYVYLLLQRLGYSPKIIGDDLVLLADRPRFSRPGEDGEDIGLSRITSIRSAGKADVYDMEVPDKGWFICSGICVHNSGKSEVLSNIVFALGLLLPKFARIFKAKQFKQFKDGFMVGIYAPDYDKAGIIFGRMKRNAESDAARAVYKDPDFDIDPRKIKGMKFPNGFTVELGSANTTANIEGKTFHLILLDESQGIDSRVIKKAIRPMKAWNNGTLIMIGTPTPEICEFSQVIERNRMQDEAEKRTGSIRKHYEFDWTYVAAENPNYLKHIEEEIATYGRHSDEFRLNYELEWLDTKGRFISGDDLELVGIKKSRIDRAVVLKGDLEVRSEFKRPAGLVASDLFTPDQVFSIDYAKSSDSTVLTVARVWWENPIEMGEESRYHIHIHDWVELQGDNLELQFADIVNVLSRFKISSGINDATGMGDPIHQRLEAVLRKKQIELSPFVFTTKSKHEGYSLLKQEISAGRITFPNSEKVQTYAKQREFLKQTRNLVKEYKQNFMAVRHPLGKGFHDDYPDSLMMLCWRVNKIGNGLATIGINPFVGNDRWWKRSRPHTEVGVSQPKSRFWRQK